MICLKTPSGPTTLVALLCLAAPAWGHVVLSQPEAPASGYYTAYFRVGHGCAGSATTSLRIEIPPEIVAARPQPKPGWSLRIEHQPLPAPVKGEGGRDLIERVSAIIWTGGPLPDDQWDEFGISAKLPGGEGPLYFPAIQTCERGQENWTQTPAPGKPERLSHPAPSVILTPASDRADPMAKMKM